MVIDKQKKNLKSTGMYKEKGNFLEIHLLNPILFLLKTVADVKESLLLTLLILFLLICFYFDVKEIQVTSVREKKGTEQLINF